MRATLKERHVSESPRLKKWEFMPVSNKNINFSRLQKPKSPTSAVLRCNVRASSTAKRAENPKAEVWLEWQAGLSLGLCFAGTVLAGAIRGGYDFSEKDRRQRLVEYGQLLDER